MVCVDCMEKGITSYNLYGKSLVIPWKQTRLPFTVQFQLTYWVNCRVLLGKLGSFYSYFGMWTTEHTRVCWPAEGHAPVWRPSMQPGKGFRQHPTKPGCRVRHVTSGLGFSVSTRAQKGSTSLQHMLSSAELIGWHFPHKHLSKWNVRLTSLVSFSLIAHSLARPPVRPPSLHPSSSSYVRDSVELYIL